MFFKSSLKGESQKILVFFKSLLKGKSQKILVFFESLFNWKIMYKIRKKWHTYLNIKLWLTNEEWIVSLFVWFITHHFELLKYFHLHMLEKNAFWSNSVFFHFNSTAIRYSNEILEEKWMPCLTFYALPAYKTKGFHYSKGLVW